MLVALLKLKVYKYHIAVEYTPEIEWIGDNRRFLSRVLCSSFSLSNFCFDL